MDDIFCYTLVLDEVLLVGFNVFAVCELFAVLGVVAPHVVQYEDQLADIYQPLVDSLVAGLLLGQFQEVVVLLAETLQGLLVRVHCQVCLRLQAGV